MTIENLKKLQEKIIRTNKVCNIIGLTCFVVSLLTGFLILITSNINGLFSIMFFLPVVIISIIITVLLKIILNGKDMETFNKEYKNIFVLGALKKKFDDLKYDPNKGFTEEEIRKIGMLDTGDRFSSNDYISGTYKNIKFEQSDIEIEEEHEEEDSDGNKTVTYQTIFKGRWMVFDFNKKFIAKIQVVTSAIPSMFFEKGKSRVRFEDEEFNKMFRVYTTVEHDAFYVLTPSIIEKMKDIRKRLNSGIMFAFVDNKLYIALNNYKDSFESNPLKPIDEEVIYNQINKDIEVITDFVDDLNLNKDLFKKE